MYDCTHPASAPYLHNISGTGFVEANTRNISIGSFSSGIVSEVYVSEGQVVKKGTPLFSLDNSIALADINLKKSQVDAAKSNLEMTLVMLRENEDHLKRAEKMKSGLSISSEEHQKRRFAVEKLVAQAKLQESELAQSRAQLDLAMINFDQLTVKAPLEGIILKVGILLGEKISESSPSRNNLILMGNHTPLHLRVQIDENDGWRFDAQSNATAYLKSNSDINFPLKFVRLEPYAQQKQQISGESTELIDTRIIECVYAMPNNVKDIFIGQQLDIFIEAKQEP
ncbi:MAG: biotin/lipoyl-binding protein [Alphaproteobacteria bacterium]|nr:biotin/lipoyl-binding protein [Alphaproteobacteria bacterium]